MPPAERLVRATTAVVADKVRKLAKNTVRATREVSDHVATIQGNSQNAVERMADGMGTLREGNKLAGESGEVLAEVA